MRLIWFPLLLAASCSGEIATQASAPDTRSAPRIETHESLQLTERDLFTYANPLPVELSSSLRLLGVYGDGSELFSAVLADENGVYSPSLRGDTAIGKETFLVEVDSSGVTLEQQSRRFRVPLSAQPLQEAALSPERKGQKREQQ